eukprot:6037668-Alexandrium_andersonii.AAC.1
MFELRVMCSWVTARHASICSPLPNTIIIQYTCGARRRQKADGLGATRQPRRTGLCQSASAASRD